MELDELAEALTEAERLSKGLETRAKSKILHSLLDKIAESKNYHLKLRK